MRRRDEENVLLKGKFWYILILVCNSQVSLERLRYHRYGDIRYIYVDSKVGPGENEA